MLDLYVCLRPVRYFKGVPSPVKAPEKVDMVIFRENTEDIYAGIEWAAESPEAKKVIAFLQNEMGVKKIRFPETSGIGIKPVSREGTERLDPRRARLRHPAQAQERHPGPQGQHHEVHRGRASATGATRWSSASTPASAVGWDDCGGKPPAGQVLVKDSIADITLQQVLTRPDEFDVIATLNLNGDYLSDALAAQVGGIGIAPGGNINYVTGHAVFEATHGTAPKYANLDKVNPGSVILSGVMMLEHLGWTGAADAHRHRAREDDRAEDRHLRLRAPDGRREGGRVLRLRRRDHRATSEFRQPPHSEELRMPRRNKIALIGAGNIGGELAALCARAASSATSCCSTSPRRRASPRARRSTSSRTAPSSATTRSITGTLELGRLRRRRRRHHHRGRAAQAGHVARRSARRST